ncbi:MAG: hypothetical protein WAT23_02800 [Chromatiaceae bacterium]
MNLQALECRVGQQASFDLSRDHRIIDEDAGSFHLIANGLLGRIKLGRYLIARVLDGLS